MYFLAGFFSIVFFAGVALLLAGPALAHFGHIPALAGLGLAAVGAVCVLLGSGGDLAMRWKQYRAAPQKTATLDAPDAPRPVSGSRLLVQGAVTGLWLLVLLGVVVSGARHPMLNDISTDLEDPPELRHAAALPANQSRDLSFPADTVETIRKAYADLGPLCIAAGADAVYERTLELAQRQPHWSITHTDPGARRFEGAAETGLFRFRDDFVVRVRPTKEGAIVDMRSKSRDGKSDLGANAKRIRGFFAQLREAFSGN